MIDRWQNDQKSNTHWLYAIPSTTSGKAKVADEQKTRDELLKVTPDMVQALAVKYLVADRRLHVEVLPENAPENAPAKAP